MGYNEPDGEHATGGSSLDYKVAATNWIAQMEPLRKMGVKLGAPAVTGSSRGMTWLKNFFDSCASQGTNCTADFFPSHWYGNFEGLASHLGEIAGAYVFPPLPILYCTNNLTDIQIKQSGSPNMLSTTKLSPIHRVSSIHPPSISIGSIMLDDTRILALSEAMLVMLDRTRLC